MNTQSHPNVQALIEDAVLPQGYAVRPAHPDDVSALTVLVNACFMEEVSTAPQSDEMFLADWGTPGFDRDTDTWVIHTLDGDIAAYGELWNVQEPHVHSFLWARVHPDHRDQGIGTYLLRRMEARAAEFIPLAPDDARIVTRTGAVKQAMPARDLLANEGYEQVRVFYRMVIEMDAPPPAPVWPDGITVRTAERTDADFRAIHAADAAIFQDHWGFLPVPYDRWLHWVENEPDFDPSLWFIAMDGDEIAAISLCRPRMTEDPGLGWIDDLGVLRPWRRQGLGLALLHHAFGVFWERGTRKVGLGVDAQSLTGATRLYEKAGMHVWRQSLSFEKELRPGIELSTQTLDEN